MTDLGRKPVRELRALTSLRGIAACWVVLYHIRLSIAGLPQFWLAVFGKGYLAVDFFFQLSGFVIWLTWHERLRDDDAAAIGQFLLKRVARIWPLHLLMLAAAVAIGLALAATGRHDPGMFAWHELPLHILLIQDWGLTDRLAWNDPAWSISAELAAYLVFPLVALLMDWRRWPSWLLVSAICVMLVALHLIMQRAEAPGLGWDITTLGVPRCIAEFFAGTATAALWLRWHDRPAVAASITGLCGIGLAIAALKQAAPETLLVPPMFACLLLVAALTAGARNNILETRPPHFLGDISYAIYLSHFLLFFVFKIAFVDRSIGMGLGLIGLFLATVIGVSTLLYYGFERPAQRWVFSRARRPIGLIPPVQTPAHPPAP